MDLDLARSSRPELAAASILCVIALVALARSQVAREPEGSAVQAPPRVARPVPTTAGVSKLREGEPLELNQAQAGDLQLLPGIGPKLAQRIVAERARRGAFARVEDLREVSGVGDVTLRRIRPLVAVSAVGVQAQVIGRGPPTP